VKQGKKNQAPPQYPVSKKKKGKGKKKGETYSKASRVPGPEKRGTSALRTIPPKWKKGEKEGGRGKEDFSISL